MTYARACDKKGKIEENYQGKELPIFKVFISLIGLIQKNLKKNTKK